MPTPHRLRSIYLAAGAGDHLQRARVAGTLPPIRCRRYTLPLPQTSLTRWGRTGAREQSRCKHAGACGTVQPLEDLAAMPQEISHGRLRSTHTMPATYPGRPPTPATPFHTASGCMHCWGPRHLLIHGMEDASDYLDSARLPLLTTTRRRHLNHAGSATSTGPTPYKLSLLLYGLVCWHFAACTASCHGRDCVVDLYYISWL